MSSWLLDALGDDKYVRAIYAALFFWLLLFLPGTGAGAQRGERYASPEFPTRPLLATFAERRAHPPKVLRIVSWNIDRGTHLAAIEAELARQHPDLCLLQEVDSHTKRTGDADVASTLAQTFRLNLAYGVEFEELSQETGGKPAYIGQATLTGLPITRARVLRFATQSGFWKPREWIPSTLPLLQRRNGGRIALITELSFHGHLLVVYNVHLESRSLGDLQTRQLEEVLSDLKRYPPDAAVVLGGDFNSKYHPATLLRRLEQQGFRSVTGEHIERTHAIAMALDWIFIRGPLTAENGSVQREVKGSDHYPIVALLRPRSGNLSR